MLNTRPRGLQLHKRPEGEKVRNLPEYIGDLERERYFLIKQISNHTNRINAINEEIDRLKQIGKMDLKPIQSNDSDPA